MGSFQAPLPARSGTFAFSENIGATYSVGRQTVLEDLAYMDGVLAVDIETFGLGVDARRIKVVTIGVPGHAVVADPRDPAQAEAIRETLERAGLLLFHKSDFDVPSLVLNGLMRPAHIAKVVDTLIYARLAEPDERASKSLDASAERWLGLGRSNDLIEAFRRLGLTKSAGFRLFDLDRPMYVQGAAIDAIVTARLHDPVRQAAHRTLTTGHPFSTHGVTGAEAWELVEREQRLNRLFLRRSARGLRVDLDYLDAYRNENETRRVAAEAEVIAHGITPGNGGQLTSWLDAAGALPPDYPRTRKTGAPSATAGNLALLGHPLARAFVTAKQITKIDHDYLAKVVELAIDDRIYPTTSILAATTGRMSMGDPPLHQFPAEARGIILADAGDKITSIDWSQIEPVVIANVAGDSKVLRGYEDGSSDLYTDVAELAKVGRKVAKVIVLAQMYGEGLRKLAADLGMDIEASKELSRSVFRAMPAVQRLIYKLKDISERYGKIFTISGRILTVPRLAAYRGVNYFVQGSAYDVLADSLIRIDDAGLAEALYLAMHDEVLCSTEAAHDIEAIMATPPERLCEISHRVPILRTDRADLGERWAAA